MPKKISSFKQSLEQLAKKDPIMRDLIRRAQLKILVPRENYFESLVNSIISQQLSTKAAESIRLRFLEEFGITAARQQSRRMGAHFPSARKILQKSDERLRACGLSGSKVSYIKNLAQAVEDGNVDFTNIGKRGDEEIIEMLTKVKGIGRWTAEMFLIFSLCRPDIFSHGDLGLKNAIKKLYRIDPKLHKKRYAKLIESWSPYQSLASRHLWASLEL